MNMNYKVKITSSKNDHFVKDGVLFAKPTGAIPMVGKDNKLFISYDLGLSIVVPAGVIGLILPPNNSSMFSVAQTGNFILMPGTHEKVSIEYKTNTDAIPRVFEKDEICAQILFLTVGDISFENVIEEETKDTAISDGVIDQVVADDSADGGAATAPTNNEYIEKESESTPETPIKE